jgi:hypothetical protein
MTQPTLFDEPKRTKPRACIRLGCYSCDASYDGITPAKLEKLKVKGWHDVEEHQTWEQSIDVSEGVDLSNWETHLGICPECYEEEARLK